MEKWRESSFCIRPFKDLHITDTGNITPCCLIQNKFFEGKVSEYKKSKVLLDFQKYFLRGDKHTFCNYCWELESAGVKSQRQQDSINRRPRVHIRFSNKCNFKCRICNPTFSSAIGKENKIIKTLDNISNEERELNNEILKDLVESMPLPVLLDISGGEPFLSKSHFNFLKYLLKKVDTSQIDINYNTNLSTLKYKNKNLTDIWKHFGDIIVAVSVDGFGRETEYSRKGFNWSNFNRNLDTLLLWRSQNLHKNFITFTTVVSIYSIYGLPDLLIYLRQKTENSKINLEWCYQPCFLNPQTLPDTEKSKIKRLYIEKYNLVWDRDRHILDEVLAILYDRNHKIENIEEQRIKFIDYTNALDKHRKDNFLEVYPQFKDWINK